MTVSNDGDIMASNGGHSARRNDEIEFDDDGVSMNCCFSIWRENGP